RFAVSREAVIQVESGLIPAERIIETDRGIKAVERHASSPTRIESLGVEDAVAGAQNRFVVQLIREANARCDRAIEHVLRIPDSGAGVAPFVAREHQAARQVSGAGIR